MLGLNTTSNSSEILVIITTKHRGEICVVLSNHGCEWFQAKPGCLIAQLVLAPVTRAVPIKASPLETSARGTGGFGSTRR